MHYNHKGSSLVILHNFANEAYEVVLNLKSKSEMKLVDLLWVGESIEDEKGRHRITIDAYGYRWFRAGDLSHLLQGKA